MTSPVIRPLDLARDAGQIAQLYRRYGYGAAVGNGLAFTGDDFARAMAQNDLVTCLVAEDQGQVVGLLGALTIDAARAARPGSVRGNHFVIESTARGSLVAGFLFHEMFERLVDLGVGSLWLRVNPANRLAGTLYARTGCRAPVGARPDADGYLAVVSHLPGLVAASRRAVAASPELGVRLPTIAVANLRSGRGRGFDEGVTIAPDGRWTIAYHMESKGFRDGGAIVDGETGQVRWIGANGVDYTERFLEVQAGAGTAPTSPAPATPVGPSYAVGGFRVGLDSWGRLRADHPDHLGPVLLDCFPDAAGHTVAYRCPPPLTAATEVRADGWTTRRGPVERTYTLGPDAISVDCRVAGGDGAGRLAVHPWCGLRTAEFALASGGTLLQGGLRPGRWPVQLPAYEAAGDARWSYDLDGATTTWSDATAGLSVAIDWLDAGRLRAEGEARADGPRLRYRLRLAARDRITLASATAEPAAPAVTVAPAVTAAWSDGRSGRTAVVRATAADGAGEVVVDPAAGLLTWRAGGQDILAKPGSGAFGSLVAVPAALWASLDSDRSDVDRGPEWSGADPRVIFTQSGQPAGPDTATWSVAVSGDFSALEVVTDVPATFAGAEAAIHLKPSAAVTTLLMADSSGHLHPVTSRDPGIDRPWGLWWGFTRRVLVPAGADRTLDIRPLSADHGEILVRSCTAGFLLTLYSRVGRVGRSRATWSVSLVPAGPGATDIPPTEN
ncbi:MAG: hypothetical protein LBR33_08580 [Propionibacteriaceae bacterium]|jgi:hypothetical protein|nr:hypothetical protein [Propionibacteriaceae bacterium]